MDMKWVERTLITIAISVIGYLWMQQTSRIEHVLQNFMDYRVYVAENFVSKKDYNRDMKKIDQKLDKILELLDKKTDKNDLYRRDS